MRKMKWQARWIWREGDPAPRNYFLYFRKKVDLSSVPEEASLSISADSRYILYLNGEYIGQGPARSFPEHQQFDSYQVEGRLNKGENVIAVLVHHFGESNFQYIEGRGGLICQLDMGKETVISDRSWKVKQCLAFKDTVPRVSCQLGFAEEYDSRREVPGWKEICFDDSSWQNAAELDGKLPWSRLERRTIPFLTEDPVFPVRVLETEMVKSPSYPFTFNLKPYFFPGEHHVSHMQVRGYLFTCIYASRSEVVDIYIACKRLKFNGKLIRNDFSKRLAERWRKVSLKPGWNPVLIDISGLYHVFQIYLVIKAQQPLRFNALKKEGKPLWKTIVSPSDREMREIWKKGEVEEDAGKIISPDHIYDDVYLKTIFEQGLDIKPGIDNPEAILSSASNYAVFHPQKKGDIRILLDFGREVVGYTEFELEGHEGITLDFNFFEAIEDGKVHFTGLNSSAGYNFSFRYITKKGRQTYRTYERRGFRYCYLTIRGMRSPLKIRYISTLLNTYPVTEKGAFHCSDERLNKIWEVGAYTLRLCMEDTYVDCPCYEQAHWVGDARGEALINYASFGAYDLSSHSLEQVSHSLKYNILPESHVPSGWRHIQPAWTFLWIEALYEYYLFTGEKRFLQRIYPALRKTCLKIGELRSERGLFRMKGMRSGEIANMIDWAAMDIPDDGEITHNNALAVRSLFTSAKIAKVLSRREDALKFTELAKSIKKAINRYCWDEKKKAYVDCVHEDGMQSNVISQQANTIVYLCDCAAKDRISDILPFIGSAPKGVVSAGSPFFMFFTFEALSREEKVEEVLSIVREKWGFMLDKGATTFWETFPDSIIEKFWLTRSYCHAWSSAPTYFLSTKVLGVSPLEPGFREVLVKPFPADLTFCSGRFPTPKGEIEISWENLPDSFKLDIHVPNGIKPKIIVPKDKKSIVYLNGRKINKGSSGK